MSSDDNRLSRRDFLKGSAATAAALGVSGLGVFSSAKAESTGPDETMSAAIIGTGSQGSFLLQRAVKVPNTKWVMCCDIQPKNLEKGLSIAKGAEGSDDYRRVLDRQDISAVIIATPIGLHAQMAIEAMRAGKHVLCEKMMAYSIDDARHMFRVSRQTGRKLQIGHQRRYNPDYQHAYKMVRDGVIGKITHIRAQWNRNGSWRRSCPDPKLERLVNWRLYRDSSQGLMAELGSHQIDVVNWMLGEVPNSVMGVSGLDYWKDGRDVPDNVQCIFTYPSGVKFQYQSLTTNQFDDFTEQIMGDQGTLILSPGKCLLYREPKAEELAWEDAAHKEESGGRKAIVLDASKTPRKEGARSEAAAVAAEGKTAKDDYLLELEDFFLSIRDGHAPLCGPREALETCVAAISANDAMDAMDRREIPDSLYKL